MIDDKMAQIGITNKFIGKIEQYLSIRMGRVIHFVDGELSQTKERLMLDTDWMQAVEENTGIFSFIIEKFFIRINFYLKPKEQTFHATVSLRYEHPTGGANGCDTFIRLEGSLLSGHFVERQNISNIKVFKFIKNIQESIMPELDPEDLNNYDHSEVEDAFFNG